MKSYTELRTDFGIDTKNTAAANLTWGDRLMNDFHRRILAKYDWPFLHRQRTLTTVADTTFINLPYDVDLVETVSVTVGSTEYSPKSSPSREHWNMLHYSDYNSDIPEYWFVQNGQLGLWPEPSSGGNTINITCRVRVVDLAVADYTTGNITTATNGDATIVGTGTTWTYPMAGRWLKIDLDDTTDSGDGLWYEISSITNTTNLELTRTYGGTSISGGSQAYTIGNMPLLPEAYQNLPELYAAFRYWTKEKDSTRASIFKADLDEGLDDLFKAYSIKDLNMVLDHGDGDNIINPNLLITL